jgi:hypothetical protein
MHPEIPIDALADLIVRQHAEKRDFIAPARELTVTSTDAGSTLRFGVGQEQVEARLTTHALRQVASYGDIPFKYLEKLVHEPGLLDRNLNHWLEQSAQPRMVRTLMGERSVARAFLSSRYRPLDNYDLAHRMVPKLRSGGVAIKSCALAWRIAARDRGSKRLRIAAARL